jgi:hypothetical protein
VSFHATSGDLIRVMALALHLASRCHAVRCQKSDRGIRDRHHVLKPFAAIPKSKLSQPEHRFWSNTSRLVFKLLRQLWIYGDQLPGAAG